VGETEPGWINEYLIPRLEEHDRGLVFDDHSEVHELPLGAKDPRVQFTSYLRRTRFPERPVAIMELFWADLSRFGRGPVTNFLVMLQLFYEAPLVLGSAFLRRPQFGLRRLLCRLILFANWLLRWPITGLNTAVILGALALLALLKLREVAPQAALAQVHEVTSVSCALAALVAGALVLARRSRGYSILLTELAVSAAIFGTLLVAALGAAVAIMGWDALAGPAPILRLASIPIMALWWLWSHIVVAAIAILFAAALWGTLRGRRRATAGTLMRPAAALGLTTIQGMIFKVLIAITWFILLAVIEPGTVASEVCTARFPADCTFLYELNSELIGIALMNMIMAAVLAIGVMALAFARGLLAKNGPENDAGEARDLPRLIVSPFIIVLMFSLTTLNFLAFYGPKYAQRLARIGGDLGPVPFDVTALIRQELLDSGIVAPFAGMSLLLLYLIVFRAVQNGVRGMVHIVRDLVDHQYTPEFRFSRFMLANNRYDQGRYPRRERIQERLDTLVKSVVSDEKCDHLIFLAHSQGTVILFDYLRSARDDATLARIGRIDVVTLGSPLGHLYGYYFPLYDASVATAGELNPKLASWTNMWRVDDPIGNSVDVVADGFVVNKRLPPGGHVNYWKEPQVIGAVLDLIDKSVAKPPPLVVPPPLPRAAQAGAPAS
jgi:hypothetical protein